MHARLDHEQARGRDPDRGVDVVDLTGRLDEAGDLDGVVDRRATLDQLVAADAHAERQAVADHPADGADDVDQHPAAVEQRAAVLVGALVGGRRQEAADDRRVAALQFDAVEPTLGAVLGDPRVPGDDLVDLGVGHRLWHLAKQRIGDGRRRPHRQPRVHRACLAAVVVDLGEDRHAVTMNSVGDRAVAGDHVAVEAVDQLLVRPIGRMRRVLLGDDQPRAAGRTGRVVGRVLLGRLAVAGVVGEVGAEDDAVAGR